VLPKLTELICTDHSSHCVSQPEIAVRSQIRISATQDVIKPKQSQYRKYSTRSFLILLWECWEQEGCEKGELKMKPPQFQHFLSSAPLSQLAIAEKINRLKCHPRNNHKSSEQISQCTSVSLSNNILLTHLKKESVIQSKPPTQQSESTSCNGLLDLI